jgi:hypothetical protein
LKSGLDFAQVSGIARLCSASQRGIEAGSDLANECIQGETLVTVVHDEELARLGVCAPRRMERDQVSPRVRRPDGHHAHMEGSGLERTGDIRSHLSTGEERLRIPGRNDLELAIVVELTHGV